MERKVYEALKYATAPGFSMADRDQLPNLQNVRADIQHYEARIERRCSAIRELLESIPGEDSNREGLDDTPLRVARMYEEVFAGYEMRPEQILSATFESEEPLAAVEEDIYRQGIIAVKDIPFYSHCEHHMVPFFGHAHIAYIPNDRVVGLSKLARLTECFARRLQIQERMTTQIADAIDSIMQPQGVMVVIQAEHLCMAMRGVQRPGTLTVTSAVRGVFKGDAARSECLDILGLRRK